MRTPKRYSSKRPDFHFPHTFHSSSVTHIDVVHLCALFIVISRRIKCRKIFFHPSHVWNWKPFSLRASRAIRSKRFVWCTVLSTIHIRETATNNYHSLLQTRTIKRLQLRNSQYTLHSLSQDRGRFQSNHSHKTSPTAKTSSDNITRNNLHKRLDMMKLLLLTIGTARAFTTIPKTANRCNAAVYRGVARDVSKDKVDAAVSKVRQVWWEVVVDCSFADCCGSLRFGSLECCRWDAWSFMFDLCRIEVGVSFPCRIISIWYILFDGSPFLWPESCLALGLNYDGSSFHFGNLSLSPFQMHATRSFVHHFLQMKTCTLLFTHVIFIVLPVPLPTTITTHLVT